MNKNLFNVNELEKSRIIEMHVNATNKQYLSEQTVKQEVTTENKDAYGPTSSTVQNGYGPDKDSVSQRVINVVKRDPKNSKRVESELMAASTSYSDFMNHLANWNNQSTSSNIWFLTLNNETRKAFLNEYARQLPTINKKLDYGIEISKGGVTTTEVATSDGTTSVSSDVPLLLPYSRRGKDTFIDNKADISPVVQQGIDQYVEELKDIITNLEPNQKLIIKRFDIGASASRFRNTGEAEKLTWKQLIEKRVDTISNYTETKLKTLGVLVPENIRVRHMGQNPDGSGTSGPNPGKIPVKDAAGNVKMAQAALSKDVTYDNIITDTREITKNLNVYGTPHQPKEEYDQYKWLSIVIQFEIVVEPVKAVKELQKIGEYSMIIKTREKVGTYKFPDKVLPKWNKMRASSGNNAKKQLDFLTKCPTF